MDDFLGTSIQYSEQQILLLEEQHAANLEKTVTELIESGFLDSDYEDSTESEYTETEEVSDSDEEHEIKENIVFSEDEKQLQLFDESTVNISPRTVTETRNTLSLTPSPRSLSRSQSQSQPNSQMIEFKAIQYLLDIILSDIKSLLIIFILMIALPHIMHENNTHSHTTDNSNVYGSAHYRHSYQCGNTHSTQYLKETSIYWFYDSCPKRQTIMNDDEDERDEFEGHSQCGNDGLLFANIITETHAFDQNKLKRTFSAKLTRHKFKVCTDRFSACNNNNMPLIWSFGTGAINGMKSQKMVRIVKGIQFGMAHETFALILSFAGIAAFAATNANEIAQF